MSTKQSCLTCKYFEERSRFCRFNPPQPVMIETGNGLTTSSKFTVITKPDIDWCSKHEEKIICG